MDRNGDLMDDELFLSVYEMVSGRGDSESVDLSRGPEWGMVAAARVGTNRLWRLPEGDAAGQRIGYL